MYSTTAASCDYTVRSVLVSVLILFLACAPFTSARCLESCGEQCVKPSCAWGFCGVLAFMCRWDNPQDPLFVYAQGQININSHTNNKSFYHVLNPKVNSALHVSHRSDSIKALTWEVERSKVIG